MKWKTLIIEDEIPARLRLEKLLTAFADKVEVIGIAKNGKEGIEQIAQLKPDLIFLDIQMPGMDGFEMLRRLDAPPIVIFCTAYDEFALKAFETTSLDYLVKPVKEERLQQSIQKLDQLTNTAGKAELQGFLESIERRRTPKVLSSLTVKSGKKIIFLKLKEVTYFKAADKYVNVYMYNGEVFLTEKTLQALGEELPENFKRIHRSLLINKDFIKEVQPYYNNRFSFILNDQSKSKLTSGRSYKKEIDEWMY